MAPLMGLTSASRPFEGSLSCMKAFQAAKPILCGTPVLATPGVLSYWACLSTPFSMRWTGVPAVQEDDCGISHPICWFSKKCNKHQLQYSTVEQEALALLLLQHFEVYVGSSQLPVVIHTNHNGKTETRDS